MTRKSTGFAILGGTFDPIHFGHLRSAVEIHERLGVEKVKLIPSFLPPHRDEPGSTPQQRLEMLALATRDVQYLDIDDREIRREGKSYSIDTLRSLRAEIGDAPLYLILGLDAWSIIGSWREWRQLTDFAHIVIIERAGEEPAMSETVTQWYRERMVEDPGALRQAPAGSILRIGLTRLDISSTRIREIFSAGRCPDYLLPGEVIDYVREHGLYREPSK